MDHVGIVVDDLAAAAEFFVELGLELQGEGSVEGRSVDRMVGLDGVRTDLAFMQTPDGSGRLELIKFHSYRLCYVRGPEGIIVELAEQIG
jgi:catechol 2,3-dioxygenase-like lactoylglutathione lyase family enzyme